ncbi:MAG: 2-oxoglutarate dehydrogenase complex dihydrolipoyllysine-residue succinyltransferase [Gammaproteobacteria bacterium]
MKNKTALEITAPDLPESVSEASLLSWHIEVGAQIKTDQLLAEVETDKVVLEVVALANGIITEILVQTGEDISAGKILARMEVNESAADAATTTQPTHAPAPAPAPKATSAPTHAPAPAPAQKQSSNPTPVPPSGPAMRRYLRDHPNAQPAAPVPTAVPVQPELVGGNIQRTPMSKLRATIARRMLQARQNTAMLTTFNEVDMGAVIDARKQYRDEFEQQHQVRLGFMSFFVKASARALQKFPIINSSIDGSDILTYSQINIGIAIASERGLVVPILRDVSTMNLDTIERQIAEYSQKAEKARLLPQDFQGGTFTISNGGVFGSLMSTPILNPPQSAILGLHTIQKRAVVVDEEIQIRPMMYLALSYDHRLIDGSNAVRFLAKIKHTLENPIRLLLEI